MLVLRWLTLKRRQILRLHKLPRLPLRLQVPPQPRMTPILPLLLRLRLLELPMYRPPLWKLPLLQHKPQLQLPLSALQMPLLQLPPQPRMMLTLRHLHREGQII